MKTFKEFINESLDRHSTQMANDHDKRADFHSKRATATAGGGPNEVMQAHMAAAKAHKKAADAWRDPSTRNSDLEYLTHKAARLSNSI